MSDANALLDRQESPDALRADARREAMRALALDPHNGEAYVALAAAAPTLDWRGREALLLRGADRDPAFEPDALHEGRLQWLVGRGQAALGWLQRAHDINPLHNGGNWSLAQSLAAEGHADAARALVAQMQTQWPGDLSTKLARFMAPVILGETDQPLVLLADPATRPPNLDQRGLNAWRATLKAIGARGGQSRLQAASMVKMAAKTGSLDAGQALLLLTMLHDLDGAFAEAELYDPSNAYAPAYLFLPATASMRADPRFMPLSRKLGLVEYWRATGNWPDFCAEPGLPYDCKSEAAKVVSSPTATKPRRSTR
jgi:tetratricopeptide (TPR) repeat protein